MGDIRAGLEELKLDGTLFAKVKYYVSGEGDPKVLNLLQEGGAERLNYFSDYVTHLIAGFEALENDISAAKDLYEIPAVTEDWILYSVKCKQLLPTHYFLPEENQLFSNVRACISQVSRADSKSLWAMITLQGGKCQLRLDRFCTHLIVSKACGIKYETASRHQIHIVTPDWVTECSKKRNLTRESEFHPKLLVHPSPNSSTALITGFMDEDVENNTILEEQDCTKAMLEQLKQRMPWNQPKSQSIISQALTQSQSVTSTSSPVYLTTSSQNISNVDISDQSIQQPQHFQWTSSPANSTLHSTSITVSSVSNTMQQSGWHSSGVQTSNMLPIKSPTQEIPTSQIMNSQNIHQPQQQLINQQQELIQISQQTQINQQSSVSPQTMVSQHQQVSTQLLQHQLTTQQQLTPQQQLVTQQQIVQQQQIIPQQQMIPQQQIISQQQITSQQQMTSQQHLGSQQQITSPQQMVQQQIMSQQQMSPQQLTSQQLVLQQKQQLMSQVHLNQQQPQQMTLQQQNPIQKQQLTPEQCQQMLLLQQQQKIQQISQQLQQSVPQNSQQFVIRETQLQQQSPTQLIGTNSQNFMVQRDAQWQQQQYQLQLQRQQQQIPGQQRAGTQWTQQLPQPPRQLIQLDAQTHQQLQQLDPQQRAQFIQKIQKQKTLLFQRHIQRQAQQQGPHIAVIRSPGKPGQPSGIQWVSQPRTQIMAPQVTAPGQKPSQLHTIQPPALTPINSGNQVIVQTGQTAQNPQVAQNQQFQQSQTLTQQQLAQLHMQKQQQQIARMQQLQQIQQQQQVVQQEPSLAPIPGNSQLPADQQLVVNAKTKTALANMLTNRLQSGTAEGSAAGQLRLMTAQHRPPPPPSQDPQLLAAYQRRTLGNITNGAAPGGSVKMQCAPTTVQQSKAQFYGHNPNLKLPPDLFLLGCIFVIVEYDIQSSEEVAVWKQVIERHGGEVELQYCPRATHVLSITQKHPIVVQALREGKRCVSAHWLSDVVNKQQVLPPWHALHFPTPFSLTDLPCTKQIISLSGFEGEDRVKVKFMLESVGAKFTKYFSRHNTLIVCRRPDGPKYKRAREWQTGVVNAQWLTDLLCGQVNALHQSDAPKYQQFSLGNPFRLDYSLVPHLMAAWKMPINITQESYDKVKQVGQGPNAMRKYKKPKLDGPTLNKDPHLLGLEEPIVISNPNPPPPEKQPRILFSGISPKKHAKRIRELGGALAASWKDATHLIMSAPMRTVKLLCCLSRCKYIVSLQWLLDCSTKNTFVDESTYMLSDPEFEKNFNCNIEKALASPNRGSILKGKTFYVTPSVIPSPSAMAEIIESAGGSMEKTRRSLVQIQEMNTGKLDYVIITVENDLHLLADVLRAEISVFSAEIVLGAIAKQSFQPDIS